MLLRLRRLGRIEERAGSPITYGNAVEVYSSGREAFAAMLDAIEGASRAVAVEMYTWSDDRLGQRIADAVAARARAGVPAFVLVDAFGSLNAVRVMAGLERAGAVVRWYHPLAPWTPRWYPNRRDHRKLLLVDGRTAFAGGMNLDEHYTEEFSGDAAWRDLTVRVRGPAVTEMVRAFVGSWMRAGGPAEAAGALSAPDGPQGKAAVQVIGGRGWLGRRQLRRGYLDRLLSAKQHVFIANAYFAPEKILVRTLQRVARRGVTVDLLLPGSSDVPLVRWAGRATYERLLGAGVRMREFAPTMLHAKIAVVDGELLLAGSANLDHRSFRHNIELAVNVFDAGAAAAALGGFAAEFEAAAEIRLEDWRRRGLQERVLEWIASSLQYWL